MGKFKELWDREADGNRHHQRSFLRYAMVLTFLFLLFLFLKKDNIIRWVEAGFTIRSQERRIEKLEAEISRLDAHNEALATNRDSLERHARENLGFCEEGEDVYILK